jgi:hypothetical protein
MSNNEWDEVSGGWNKRQYHHQEVVGYESQVLEDNEGMQAYPSPRLDRQTNSWLTIHTNTNIIIEYQRKRQSI